MEEENLRYPKSVYFILTHQIFERYAFWGIVVVLPLFLRNVLDLSDDSATAIYHAFTIFGYFSSFVGAIVADSYFGKFRTIVGFFFVYFIGTLSLTASALPMLSSGLMQTAVVVGLIFTALSSGSIKPCIIAYGGDQFVLPQQQKQLDAYFPLLYLVINFSLFLTAIITPILRRDISCFNQQTCYSLAFIVPFACVVIAFVILLMGKSSYSNVQVNDNVVGKSFQCIKTALLERYKKSDRRNHWLDYADSNFDENFIQNVKTVLNLLVLFLPVTMFWALFDQQFSRWTFQASRMNDNIFGYAVKPDQFATFNFVLTFAFIPIFEKLIFPGLSKCNMLKKPLQRVATGAIFASLAFVISGIVEIQIESTLEPLPVHMQSQLNVINGLPCNVHILLNDHYTGSNSSNGITPYGNHIFRNLPAGIINVNIKSDVGFDSNDSISKSFCSELKPFNSQVELLSSQGQSILLSFKNSSGFPDFYIVDTKINDDLSKSLESNSKLRILYAGLEEKSGTITLEYSSSSRYEFKLTGDSGGTEMSEITPRKYSVKLLIEDNTTDLEVIEVFTGGNYVLTVAPEISDKTGDGQFMAKMYTIIEPNSIHMVWLLPQYCVMSVAEVMLEISLTGFAYSQAPENMKSLLQVINLIPPALGGILVVVLSKIKIFNEQSNEFFLFAAINFVAVTIFIFLANRYKPVENCRQRLNSSFSAEDNKAYDDKS